MGKFETHLYGSALLGFREHSKSIESLICGARGETAGDSKIFIFGDYLSGIAIHISESISHFDPIVLGAHLGYPLPPGEYLRTHIGAIGPDKVETQLALIALMRQIAPLYIPRPQTINQFNYQKIAARHLNELIGQYHSLFTLMLDTDYSIN